tara:strand:- start:2982 stop:3425 length:444 start_codon:yes stop_codon:yes gene_type:complete
MRDPDQSYSLTNIEDAIEDAVSSDCTPEQIYEAIRTSLRRTLTYHRVCVRTANEVLRLVHGTEHKDKVISLHEKELDESLTDDKRTNTYREGKEMTYQEMIDAGYEMTGEGIWWPKEPTEGEPLPEVDYNNPYVCAKIDELAGDNRN